MSMVQVLKKTVTIQTGGRVEVVSEELPVGEEAEVIVMVSRNGQKASDLIGLYSNEPELLDEIVSNAMNDRQRPLRQDRG